jgi:hypothetical protein
MRTVTRLTSSLPIGMLLLSASACTSPSAPTRVADENASVISVAQEDMLPGVGQANTMGTEAVNGAAAVRPVYFAVAVSAGLDRYRNDVTGYAVSSNLQVAWNNAVADCENKGGGSCNVDNWCAVGASTPYVAFARSSVYSARYLDRGVSGFACNYTTRTAAVSRALSGCSLSGCYLRLAGRAR